MHALSVTFCFKDLLKLQVVLGSTKIVVTIVFPGIQRSALAKMIADRKNDCNKVFELFISGAINA